MSRRGPERASADLHAKLRSEFRGLTGLGSVGLLMASVLLATSCSVQIRMGNRPDTNLLETTLRPGESTQTDVVRVLGQPYGKGRAMLPIQPDPRTMWCYYYGEGDLSDARQLFLFVFFDQDRYDGYLWFSSLSR